MRPAIALPALAVVFVAHSVYLSCVTEDAHITFRYAANWVAGHGLVWNVSEAPVEGYTNFLWVALCAGILRLGLDLFVTVQAVGIAAALATMALTYRFARRRLRCGPGVAMVPVMFLAVSGPLATWASSGMETTTFGLCLLGAAYGVAGYWPSRGRGRLIAASATAVVATLLRPEGALVFAVLMGVSVSVSFDRLRQTARDHLAAGLVYAVPFGLYYVWRYWYFGDPLPNTFYAKTDASIWQYLRGLEYLGFFGAYYLLPVAVPLLLAAWERGLPRIAWPPDWSRAAAWGRAQAGLAVAVTLTSVYAAYVVWVGGDYMAMYRFMVPIVPLIYLLLAACLVPLFERRVGQTTKQILAGGVLAAGLAATLVHSTPLEQRLFVPPPRQHGHYTGVEAERWHVARLGTIGRFFAGYRRSSRESLATRGIGAIGYYSGLEVHDVTGLTDPHIAHTDVAGFGLGWAGHERMDLDYSLERRPTFFMVDRMFAFDPESLEPPPGTALEIAEAIERNYPRADQLVALIRRRAAFVDAHYRLRSVWLVDERNGEAGYFSFLELTTRGGP